MRLLNEIIFTLIWAFIAAIFVIWLTGCSTAYWGHDSEPVPVMVVVEVDYVTCGEQTATMLGCADRNSGVITIKRGLSPDIRSCVEAHERRHLERGDSHPENAPKPLALDCGDGRVIPQ